MAREPIPTWFFALVVVRRDDHFLLVEECCRQWYLPAGRVEPGETLARAALRETLEETGVPIVLDGILRLQHTPLSRGSRVRVVFTGHPADDTPPKARADEESLRAAWFRLDELDGLQLRSPEVRRLLTAAAGGAVAPLDILGHEGEG
jgi:phosphatase NudJ